MMGVRLRCSTVQYIYAWYQIQPAEYGDEQADAGREYPIRLATPNTQARTGAGKYSFPQFS